jgi:RHS repeat-associated protein
MAYYYTRDHLGSIRELVNGSGAIVSRLSYDPYGKTTVVSGTTLPTFGYAGMLWHQTSGEYQTWHRIYDPTTGRWQSEDPIGERGGLNLYGYADQDPIERIDLLGLCTLGDYQEDSLKVVITNAGETPNEKKWLNRAMDVGKFLGPDVSAVTGAASKSQKAAVAIEQLYASTGYTFNIWIQLKYSCCVCNKGQNQWQKQSPLQNEVTASGNSDAADPGPDYMVNYPDVGKYIGADVQAAVDSLRNQAKQNCKGYAPKEDPSGDATPLQP